MTGYRGVFLIDVNTADLRRLTVQFLKPPPDSGVQSGRIVTDYARQKVGETVALLPISSLLSLLFTGDGTLAVNETSYGSCKLFGAESTLDFGLNTESSQAKKTTDEAAANPPIPEGLELVTRIITPCIFQRNFFANIAWLGWTRYFRTERQTAYRYFQRRRQSSDHYSLWDRRLSLGRSHTLAMGY